MRTETRWMLEALLTFNTILARYENLRCRQLGVA